MPPQALAVAAVCDRHASTPVSLSFEAATSCDRVRVEPARLGHLVDHKAGTPSGGEQVEVALSGALAKPPDPLLLDRSRPVCQAASLPAACAQLVTVLRERTSIARLDASVASRTMTELLLAEPEASVRGFLERQLRSDGFDVLAFSSAGALPRFPQADVLVLGEPSALDAMRVPDCPVVVLGSADPGEKVRALERADDYLARPFAYEELVARIRAVLRRCPPRSDLIDVGELVIDRAARRVVVRGREVPFSQKELAFLVKLASDPDRVFTREQLLRDVWGYRAWAPTRTVESHASRVRCKLAAAGLGGWVVNAWGVGYKLRPTHYAASAAGSSAA